MLSSSLALISLAAVGAQVAYAQISNSTVFLSGPSSAGASVISASLFVSATASSRKSASLKPKSTTKTKTSTSHKAKHTTKARHEHHRSPPPPHHRHRGHGHGHGHHSKARKSERSYSKKFVTSARKPKSTSHSATNDTATVANSSSSSAGATLQARYDDGMYHWSSTITYNDGQYTPWTTPGSAKTKTTTRKAATSTTKPTKAATTSTAAHSSPAANKDIPLGGQKYRQPGSSSVAAATTTTTNTPAAAALGTSASSGSGSGGYSSGSLTWYNALGVTGKCGLPLFDDSPIPFVALSLYDIMLGTNPEDCWKCVSITAQGVTKTAIVADSCEACEASHVDVQESFFAEFDDVGAGNIPASWEFVDCPTGYTKAALEAITA